MLVRGHTRASFSSSPNRSAGKITKRLNNWGFRDLKEPYRGDYSDTGGGSLAMHESGRAFGMATKKITHAKGANRKPSRVTGLTTRQIKSAKKRNKPLAAFMVNGRVVWGHAKF